MLLMSLCVHHNSQRSLDAYSSLTVEALWTESKKAKRCGSALNGLEISYVTGVELVASRVVEDAEKRAVVGASSAVCFGVFVTAGPDRQRHS